MNLKDVAFWLMICVVISLCIHLIMMTKTEAFNCLNSPLTYGVSKLTSTYNNPITCSCSDGTGASLMFDKNKTWSLSSMPASVIGNNNDLVFDPKVFNETTPNQ